jgi:hypothetical protein
MMFTARRALDSSSTLALQASLAICHAVAVGYLAFASAGAVWAGYASLTPAARLWLWLGAALGLAWTIVNTHALLQKKSWAERSSLAYWLLPSAFWCCIPIPIWAAWQLYRSKK